MPIWAWAGVPYFIYVGAFGLLVGDLPRSARMLAAGSALLGLALSAAAATPVFWLRSLVLPAVVLLVAYRASGFLWRGPMFEVEARLGAADRALGISALARRTPRWTAELLELSYAGVYPLIPVALGLHLAYSKAADADLFWTVVLVTDYVCFAALPFIQTRPPRAFETAHPWRACFRPLNLRLLNHASTRMNTVPSGHAAEALAAALLVIGAPPAIVAAMFFAAAAVSAGAVLGRYHYSVDVVAGWLTAVVVFVVVTGRW